MDRPDASSLLTKRALPAGDPAARIDPVAAAHAAAAPAPVTATAAPAPVSAAAAVSIMPLYCLDRARRVRGVTDDGAVDGSGRYAGGSDETDSRGHQHREQDTTHFEVSSPRWLSSTGRTGEPPRRPLSIMCAAAAEQIARRRESTFHRP